MMHSPIDGVLLAFPVRWKPYIVADFRTTRDELRRALGAPHIVETDPTRTAGGEEDYWAWELPSGQRLLVGLDVTTGKAILCCNPPDAGPAVVALGMDAERLAVHAAPVVHPSWVSG